MKISEGIKNIQFFGFIKYNFSIGFNLISEADELQFKDSTYYSKFKNCIHYILDIIKVLLSPIFISNFKHSNRRKIIFLLAPPDVQQRRKDIAELFKNVSNLTDACDQISFTYKSWTRYSLIRTFKLSIFVIGWIYQLFYSRLSFRKKARIIFELTQLYDFQNILDKLPKYNLAIVFYDANLYNNFFVQYFRHKECKTVTLQHGVMVSRRTEVENNLDFKGIEFSGFISDYFLAWNEFTRREALKGGIPDEKIKVLGIAKCIGKEEFIKEKNKKNCIGVLLDGIYSNSNNKKLIEIINKFCVEKRVNYILKYHPAYKGNEFHPLMNEYGRTLPLRSTIEDLIACSDAIVVANSTALFELACLNVPFYRFKSDPNIDKYRDLKIPMFSNEKELIEISENQKGYSQQIRLELCGPYNNIEFSYTSFLNSFIYEK